MKWLTIEEIEKRSNTAEDALEVSYEHWNQLYNAKAKELRAEYKRTDEELTRGDYCGLCTYLDAIYGSHGKCTHCIFDSFCDSGDDDLWGIADGTLNDWFYGEENADWHTWKRAAKTVRDKLKELMH